LRVPLVGSLVRTTVISSAIRVTRATREGAHVRLAGVARVDRPRVGQAVVRIGLRVEHSVNGCGSTHERLRG